VGETHEALDSRPRELSLSDLAKVAGGIWIVNDVAEAPPLVWIVND
jgi:hypothetical protein